MQRGPEFPESPQDHHKLSPLTLVRAEQTVGRLGEGSFRKGSIGAQTSGKGPGYAKEGHFLGFVLCSSEMVGYVLHTGNVFLKKKKKKKASQ